MRRRVEASASSPGAARQAAAGGDGRLGGAASARLGRPAGCAGGVDELLLFLTQEAAGQACRVTQKKNNIKATR